VLAVVSKERSDFIFKVKHLQEENIWTAFSLETTALSSFETSAITRPAMQLYTPEKWNFQQHRCAKLKSLLKRGVLI
jgi:hypothetical protein